MKALTCQMQAQIVESERRQELRLIELSRRQDAFSRWMVGTTVGIVILIANMASRYF
jgi:invasion protein IalB